MVIVDDAAHCTVDEASTARPDEIKEFRRVHGISTREAGELVHVTASTWERWEDRGRPMHLAFFELALLKVRMLKC